MANTMSRSLYYNLGVVHLLDAQVITATTDSLPVDTEGFEGLVMSVNIGAAVGSGNSTYFAPVLQESDTLDDDDFTDVAAADMYGAFAKVTSGSLDQLTQVVGYSGDKRYVRVEVRKTSTPTSLAVSVDAILGDARHMPVTAPAASALVPD